jgi:hypothetical protein
MFVRYSRDSLQLRSFMYSTEHLGPKNFTNLFRYSREFVTTVIVITEFDCSCIRTNFFRYRKSFFED